LLGLLEQTDFYAQGRTVDKLGLSGMNAAQIGSYLHDGELLRAKAC
jgi:hypothetical protein